jgi:hypothetical protein
MVIVLAASAINCGIEPRSGQTFPCDDDKASFIIDQHAELDLYSASSLKKQSVDRHVAPPGHIIMIPSQPVFALSHELKQSNI